MNIPTTKIEAIEILNYLNPLTIIDDNFLENINDADTNLSGNLPLVEALAILIVRPISSIKPKCFPKPFYGYSIEDLIKKFENLK